MEQDGARKKKFDDQAHVSDQTPDFSPGDLAMAFPFMYHQPSGAKLIRTECDKIGHASGKHATSGWARARLRTHDVTAEIAKGAEKTE